MPLMNATQWRCSFLAAAEFFDLSEGVGQGFDSMTLSFV
jgi:hypothetical protein